MPGTLSQPLYMLYNANYLISQTAMQNFENYLSFTTNVDVYQCNFSSLTEIIYIYSYLFVFNYMYVCIYRTLKIVRDGILLQYAELNYNLLENFCG